MKIYTVTAYRFGNRESHSYVVTATTDKEFAIKKAEEEEYRRGGNKYQCEVIEWENDHSIQVIGKPLESDKGKFKYKNSTLLRHIFGKAGKKCIKSQAHLRHGQATMNVLHDLLPNLYIEIVATDADIFYIPDNGRSAEDLEKFERFCQKIREYEKENLK